MAKGTNYGAKKPSRRGSRRASVAAGARAPQKGRRVKRKKGSNKRRRKRITRIVLAIVLIAIVVTVAALFIRSCYETDADQEMGNVIEPHRIDASLKAGDTIKFGSYEQDGNANNGKEPIEWNVVEVADSKALLLSSRSLDCRPYSSSASGLSWETSELRSWLNGEFLREAFTGDEVGKIALTSVANPGCIFGIDEGGLWTVTNDAESVQDPLWASGDGAETEDYLFILNADEVKAALGGGADAGASLTEQAQDAYIKASLAAADKDGAGNESELREKYRYLEGVYGKGFCNWWLRSPGMEGAGACVVSYLEGEGIQTQAADESAGVRPAMWVLIDSAA